MGGRLGTIAGLLAGVALALTGCESPPPTPTGGKAKTGPSVSRPTPPGSPATHPTPPRPDAG